uniref:Uncharacterized protein n=1 Tax=uncultured marine virus TaxID=186617 RepID=A0A0F7L2X0_9VIRU|nr:hypothetical protein [uncultured marine virus]
MMENKLRHLEYQTAAYRLILTLLPLALCLARLVKLIITHLVGLLILAGKKFAHTQKALAM